MNEFIGIPSLFISCLEYLLLVNAIIFGQKNKVNLIAFIIIAVYSTNHLIEFFICQFGIESPGLLFINFTILSFIPPLSLLLILKFWRHETKLQYVIFLPTLSMIYFFASYMNAFQVTKCYYIYSTYIYPLRYELGLSYFALNIAGVFILVFKLKEIKLRYKRHLNIALLSSLSLAVILPMLILILFPSANIYAESILNKFAFFYVLGLTYFSLKNKTELLSEKG